MGRSKVNELSECPRCGCSFPPVESSSSGLSHCPQCGLALKSESEETLGGRMGSLLVRYLSDLGFILSQPTQFFRQMPVSGSLAIPLAFALVSHWLGSALGFLWQLVLGASFARYLTYLVQVTGDVVDVDFPGRGAGLMAMTDRLMAWFFGAGPVLIDPFMTLVGILWTAFIVYVGSRLLVPGRTSRVTFDTALRIVCFGMTPSVLAAIPLFGGFLSSLGIVLVTTVGAREVYRVGTGRAVIIALFPRLLLVAAMGVGILSVLLFFFQMFSSVFH